MGFFERFKKKEKKSKSPKPKVVTQRKANGVVSGILFLIIAIVLSGTVRNFTAVGEVERLQEEAAILQQILYVFIITHVSEKSTIQLQ